MILPNKFIKETLSTLSTSATLSTVGTYSFFFWLMSNLMLSMFRTSLLLLNYYTSELQYCAFWSIKRNKPGKI
jgi:hypothetical protein